MIGRETIPVDLSGGSLAFGLVHSNVISPGRYGCTRPLLPPDQLSLSSRLERRLVFRSPIVMAVAGQKLNSPVGIMLMTLRGSPNECSRGADYCTEASRSREGLVVLLGGGFRQLPGVRSASVTNALAGNVRRYQPKYGARSSSAAQQKFLAGRLLRDVGDQSWSRPIKVRTSGPAIARCRWARRLDSGSGPTHPEASGLNGSRNA